MTVDTTKGPTEPTKNIRQRVLDIASEAVNHSRMTSYGPPEQNFERIARLWTAHLRNIGLVNTDQLEATDVALMLALVKIARLAENSDHLDSWVDIAGYAACGAEVGGCK